MPRTTQSGPDPSGPHSRTLHAFGCGSAALRPIKRLLRSPRLIIGELALLALAGALGAALPQAGVATTAELARLHDTGPVVAMLVKVLALDHVFRSVWFLVATGLTAASLLVVIVEQVKRLRRLWSQPLTEAHFQRAPLRAEFERAVPAGLAPRLSPASCGSPLRLWTEGRIGLLGSPIFHLGLLLIIVAGAMRALFGNEAVVDLLEGETLAPTAAAWAAQWPGLLAEPFQLRAPVTLREVAAIRYQAGDLRDLKVRLAIERNGEVRESALAVNHDLQMAGGRLFLGSDFGTAAVLEWRPAAGPPIREAALLANQRPGVFEGSSSGPNGLRAFLRAEVDSAGHHPSRIEVRVMKERALLFTGDAEVGQVLSLPSGVRLALRGLPFWARVRGSRDPSLGLAYAGFAFVLVGAIIIFIVPVGRGASRHSPPNTRCSTKVEDKVSERAGSSGMRPSRGNLAAWPLLLACAVAFSGCQPSSFEQARQLVEHYNSVVSEAYRRGDVKLIDPVVGPNEGRKLTGLIGVRLDLGLTLDSQLLSLEVTGVEKKQDVMRIRTKERWRYRDLKIGSGAQAGEDSLDSYEMLYVFKQLDGAWVADEICFTAPPQVGRKQPTWSASQRADNSADVSSACSIQPETREPGVRAPIRRSEEPSQLKAANP
jgi:hypothetical protein